MDDVAGWGIEAMHRAIDGLKCKTAVHICYGYGIKANIDWKNSLGEEWRQYEKFFPALAKSRINQVSLECINSRVPLKLLSLLEGKDLLVGVIDVATDKVETPEQVADVIGNVTKVVPKEKIVACTNCGMHAAQNKIALAVIFKISIKLRNELDALVLIGFFVRCEGHPKDGHTEWQDRVGNSGGDIFITRRHVGRRVAASRKRTHPAGYRA